VRADTFVHHTPAIASGALIELRRGHGRYDSALIGRRLRVHGGAWRTDRWQL